MEGFSFKILHEFATIGLTWDPIAAPSTCLYNFILEREVSIMQKQP